jgi:hypothetical protein
MTTAVFSRRKCETDPRRFRQMIQMNTTPDFPGVVYFRLIPARPPHIREFRLPAMHGNWSCSCQQATTRSCVLFTL